MQRPTAGHRHGVPRGALQPHRQAVVLGRVTPPPHLSLYQPYIPPLHHSFYYSFSTPSSTFLPPPLQPHFNLLSPTPSPPPLTAPSCLLWSQLFDETGETCGLRAVLGCSRRSVHRWCDCRSSGDRSPHTLSYPITHSLTLSYPSHPPSHPPSPPAISHPLTPPDRLSHPLTPPSHPTLSHPLTPPSPPALSHPLIPPDRLGRCDRPIKRPCSRHPRPLRRHHPPLHHLPPPGPHPIPGGRLCEPQPSHPLSGDPQRRDIGVSPEDCDLGG